SGPAATDRPAICGRPDRPRHAPGSSPRAKARPRPRPPAGELHKLASDPSPDDPFSIGPGADKAAKNAEGMEAPLPHRHDEQPGKPQQHLAVEAGRIGARDPLLIFGGKAGAHLLRERREERP